MLTKRDLELINAVVNNSIKNAFQDFYDNLFEPAVTRFEKKFQKNDKEHQGMVEATKELQQSRKEMNQKFIDLADYMKTTKSELRS